MREAEALAAALDDPRRLGQVSLFLSNRFRLLGEHDQAIAAAQRALAFATAGGEVVQQALASYYPRQGLPHPGRLSAGDRLSSGRPWHPSRGRGATSALASVILPAVYSRAYLAVCHAELGTFAEGRAFGEEGLRIAEAVTHPGSLIFASWGIGVLAPPPG